MNFNLTAISTQIIIYGRNIIGTSLNWAGHQISLGIGQTGLYQTSFWQTIASIWAKISPTLSSITTYLTTTGFGLSIILGAITLICARSCIKNFMAGDPISGVIMAVFTVACAILTLTAFSYGGAIVA